MCIHESSKWGRGKEATEKFNVRSLTNTKSGWRQYLVLERMKGDTRGKGAWAQCIGAKTGGCIWAVDWGLGFRSWFVSRGGKISEEDGLSCWTGFSDRVSEFIVGIKGGK